ncbi:MAG TPA: formyltransferase family protein [Puia sp.]|jgi:methionyl-tRNA formyltransferase|nr:formyltransferase family protein [Puia sp.]
MSPTNNIIAIGRSRYLYEGIKHLILKGYICIAIVTEEAYEEYDIKHTDFETLAAEIGARFFMMKSINNEDLIQIIKENKIRAAISVNWKYTIPKSFLDLFECGILNFHLGNLPDYKGNATVNWTIINGENKIYGNIHKMDPVLDAGDVISRKAIPITEKTYIADILKQAEKDVPKLYESALKKVLKKPNSFEIKGSLHGLRCFPRLPEDSQVNWNDAAKNISRLVRASSEPYNGAYSFLNGEKIIIWKARVFKYKEKFLATPGHVIGIQKETKTIHVACGEGMLEIQEIEYKGSKMAPSELIKSIRIRFKQDNHV